jgi:PAS domain S-box-containing protein
LEKIKNYIESTDDIVIVERLKEALLAGKNNFKELFNSNRVPQWMYYTDSLRFLFVNDAAIREYGYTEKEFLKMTILEISPQEDAQKLILYTEFMKTTNEPFSVVNFHLKKNNETVLVETTYVNIRYEGQPCVLVTSSDIKHKIELEEKISLLKVTRQQKITRATIIGQEKERDQISKELQENINQLLAAAKIYLGLARSNGKLRLDFVDHAEKILQKAISEIRSISNSLVPSTLKLIGFTDSLKDLVKTYQVTQTFNINLSLEKKLDYLDPEIQISLFRIVQEQMNNILKHSEAQNIIISLTVTDQIILSIIDDGKGFDTKIEHTGLGISNIRNRVALYNGTVKILSEPKKGFALLINIPNEVNKKSNVGMNVLIVEDDLDDQKIITRAFTEVAPHCNITYLNDGKMLVDLLQSFPGADLPSLIVLDYNMPLLNGLETLKILELDQRFNKIPKIIYSSSSQNYIKNLCYSANAKAYITKGITMDEIKENIQEMLSFV